MPTQSDKIMIKGSSGEDLAARLDKPNGPIRAYALFAHCFTCSKDIFAAQRIAQGLTDHGFAVLRFDFTGLGASDGDFANTNFSSNVQDLIAVSSHMRDNLEAPSILVGHSLGGAAVLAAAPSVPEAKAICTVGAPADPAHVAENFTEYKDEINEKGEAEVLLVGRPFRIKKQFLEDIASQKLEQAVSTMGKALLVFHSPIDATVGVENAGQIFGWAKHPKSFVSLDTADHILSSKEDATYVANVIASWASRYVKYDAGDLPTETTQASPDSVLVTESCETRFTQTISIGGRHTLTADEPKSIGGGDFGPSPYELLLAGLGACTTMTLRMYAERKGLKIGPMSVALRHDKVHATDCATCETENGKIDQIEREISFGPDVDEETKTKLLEISEKCPVHRTLHSEVHITTRAT